MVSAGDFRNGVTFEMDGQVYQIVEFQHVKPGKGAAFVRAKIKNVIQGSVVERTFNPTEKFPTAFIERKDMVYSYSDDGIYYFLIHEIINTVITIWFIHIVMTVFIISWIRKHLIWFQYQRVTSAITLSSLRRMISAVFFHIRARYSA